MIYELLGRAHAALAQDRGQGTVEYVGLILLMAVVLAAVVSAANGTDAAGIAKTVVTKLNDAIQQVGGAGPKGTGA